MWYIIDKLVFGTYKELLPAKKKTNNPTEKWTAISENRKQIQQTFKTIKDFLVTRNSKPTSINSYRTDSPTWVFTSIKHRQKCGYYCNTSSLPRGINGTFSLENNIVKQIWHYLVELKMCYPHNPAISFLTRYKH